MCNWLSHWQNDCKRATRGCTELPMPMYCLGCGIDLTSNVCDRRNLCDSNDVILLWKTFMNHVADEIDEDSAGLIRRKCYYAYKKYIGLQESLEESLCKSLQQLHL